MDNFTIDLQRGKRGEDMIINALAARGHKVIDMRDDVAARYNDIDLLLINKQNQQTTLEVKNDIASNRTGNVFIEYENSNNKRHCGEGWFCYCKAAHMAFIQEDYCIAHIVALDELRQVIQANNYKKARCSNAAGYLLPVAALANMQSYVKIEL